MSRTTALSIVAGLLAGILATPAASAQQKDIEAQLQRLLERFPDADANKDGKLTAAEAMAYRKAMVGKSGGGRSYSIEPDHADVKYGPHERNVLDLWLAKPAGGKPTPLAIYIHGGGFSGGDKKSARMDVVRQLTAAGISVAAFNYRLIDSGPFPIPMLDGARALQFLRYHAAKYKLNKRRFACFGGSAGGCMSMWLAFHDDLADPDSKDPVLRESSRLTCAAPVAGQSCLDRETLLQWFGVKDLTEHPSTRRFFGIETKEELETPRARAVMKEASPFTHLTKDDPPLYMTYGQADTKVTEKTSPGTWVHHPRFGTKLKPHMDRLGIECHVQYRGGPEIPQYADAVDFMIKKLKQ